jgi:chorismate dehydratase
MKHPIAMIPYANMAPYREMGSPRGCCFVDCVPRESIQALKDRCVWAAAVPVGGLSELEGQIRFLGRFGIAVRRQAMSVLFFSDRAFQTFNRHHTISLTGESASSVRLLYLLMGYRLGFDALPSVVPKGNPSNGCLVIGDRALRWAGAFERSGAVRGYGYVTDLGQQVVPAVPTALCFRPLGRPPRCPRCGAAFPDGLAGAVQGKRGRLHSRCRS